MGTGYLSLVDVRKSYDGASNAVEHISLDIEKGEFVTFLGPSGSGKTTTLVMIAGFEEPSDGQILLAGKDLTRLKPWHRNIGMVFQNYALFPHMTVADNIGFPLKMRGMAKPDAARKVGAVLELVGLGTFSGRYPRELSGGQQQRVALARGLVFNPHLLLLDEPLGALDKNLREQMQVEIKRIHKEVGITMIYVTHDQTEAMTMSDRIAVFSKGKLEQVGAPLDIYHRPSTRFVGEFVGESNFFKGRVDAPETGRLSTEPGAAIQASIAALSGFHAGDRVDIMVRPERVRLLNGGPAAGTNEMAMTVSAIVNYGESITVLGDASGTPMRMRMTGALANELREGAMLRVGWSPDDVHLIKSA